MLVLNEISKTYPAANGQTVTALHLPHLTVKPGEKLAILGRSGSGKSTLLNIIAGIIRPSSGTVRFGDTELTRLDERQLDRFRARRIGYVFQNFHLLPGFTALENVLIALHYGGTVPRRERLARARELLVRVGLEHRLHHRPNRLSNGEQQRVAIARALANGPALLLADEPTASLDEESSHAVMRLMTETCREIGAAFMLSTHDRSLLPYLDAAIELGGSAPARKGEEQNHDAS